MLLHAVCLLEPGPVLIPRQHPGPAGGGVAPHDVPRVIVHHRLGPGLTLHRQPLVPGGRWLSVLCQWLSPPDQGYLITEGVLEEGLLQEEGPGLGEGEPGGGEVLAQGGQHVLQEGGVPREPEYVGVEPCSFHNLGAVLQCKCCFSGFNEKLRSINQRMNNVTFSSLYRNNKFPLAS